MTKLVAHKVSIEVAGTSILRDATVSLQPGELVAILGPNGAGKTSLLRALMGLTKTSGGSVELDGVTCSEMAPQDRARLVSYLPQHQPLAWPNRVMDVVALGRFAHGAALDRLNPEDTAAVMNAITACDLNKLAERATTTLSGGELARVHFARAIAAQTPLLIADEPVAELDPRHQIRIANLLRHYVDDGGGALVVLHEIPLAARVADHLVWMKNGRIFAEGTPAETLTSQMMEDVYGVRAHVGNDEHGFDVRIEGTA
ncbi:MAG: ABC transporter ATP-binding protein [Gammaproteobacteria bacterium]|jgi:iron complex transport system ATP-binding protein|nr:ABC transporter ATP-binding protein [Gammaproteobacteria bacterium]